MKLRFNTLFNVLSSKLKVVKKTLVLLTVLLSCPVFSQNVTIEDLKKEANKLFEEDEFTKAYKLFSQLVSNYPKEPEYNFKLGVCMIYSEPDKKKCLPYLLFANSKPKESPAEVKFYLGKAYHINYLFDEAIKYYNEYKAVGSSSKQKKLMVDREIISCGYGKRLLSNLSDLEIISKKQLNEIDYFRSYDLKNIGGKLLIKPETFRTVADKRKKEKSVIYLPRTADKVFFSSYGSNTTSKDIYYSTKLPNGEFDKPSIVIGINTDYDEDYPFLHPNGKILYFASKGHNGMGGYDIFKSEYNESNDTWSQPINLEFPINSPDDDYLYVTDSLEKVAYFSTGRQSLPGKIDVLKINTERKIIDFLALKGTVVKENSEQSLKSKITIKNMANGEIVGVFEAGDNGDYLMDLPNGAKLLYTVETPGLKTQSERVGLPLVTNARPLKQTISYDKGILKIINYFNETATDDSYLQYLSVIEKKSKLDVNEGLNKLGPQVANNFDPNNITLTSKKDSSDSGPTVTDLQTDTNTKVAVPTKTLTANVVKSVNNKELANIAKQDATDSKKEANQLVQDSWDAEQVGEQKKIEADKKINEANEILKNAESITNEDEKNKEIEKGNLIKAEAINELAVATKILNFANSLKEDAANKQKEADLNEQYSNELEKVISSKDQNNTESLTKLEDLQKQIDQLSSKQNSSENLYNSIKSDIEQKEKQILEMQKANAADETNLTEIKNEIAKSETELSKTRKKKDKEIIVNQINDLKTDQIEKEKQVLQSQEEIKKLNDELVALKNELDLTTKIKTETIAASKTNVIENDKTNLNENAVAINSNTLTPNKLKTEKITDKILEEKYKDKLIITDNNNINSLKESALQANKYNKEIDVALATNKKELLKAKTPSTKQEITTEIKKLETSKKENNKLIAATNKQIELLNKNNIVSNNTPNPSLEKTINLNPIRSKNSSDALKNLDILNTELNTNDNSNFEYNSYQNTEAQKLKIEADSKINDAIAQQKKLKDFILIAKENIINAQANNDPKNITPTQLNIEAEELFAQAQKLKNEAQTKSGAEKEKLLTEATSLDDKGNEKNLLASTVTKNDNNAVYKINAENTNNLINSNLASEEDLNEAKKLKEEASIAFKQAESIREEANSLSNVSAKLGSLSNAEEKESLAITKQLQAIDLLKKSNPNVVLKTALTSTSSIKVTKDDPTINTKLETVNNELDSLAATKISAYLKLYQANTLEIEQLNENLKTNEKLILNTPSLKSQSITLVNNIKLTAELKQKSDTSRSNNNKLNNLVFATQKQIEAIKQANDLIKKADNLIAANLAVNNVKQKNNSQQSDSLTIKTANDNKAIENTNSTIKDNTIAKNTNDNKTIENTNSTINDSTTSKNPNDNKTVENTNPTTKDNTTAKNTNDNKTIENTNPTIKDNTANKNPNDNKSIENANSIIKDNTAAKNTNDNKTIENANSNIKDNTTAKNTNENNTIDSKNIDTTSINVKDLSKIDTTANQVINYFENKTVALKNPEATKLKNNALTELKNTEQENKIIENEIITFKNQNPSSNQGKSSSELKVKADALTTESDELNEEVENLTTIANGASGSQKDSLINKVNELKSLSSNKRLEASVLNLESNDIEYKTNTSAIKELLPKLKTDNLTLYQEVEKKNDEINVLRDQSEKLREEANAQTNISAKTGVLNNAEEKEAELIVKQNELIKELQKQYPDFIVKPLVQDTNIIIPAALVQKQKQIQNKQALELANLTNALSLEYETRKTYVPNNLSNNQNIVKRNADNLNAESKRLLIQSSQEQNLNKKSKLLALAAKTGNAANEQLQKITSNKITRPNNTNNITATNVQNTNVTASNSTSKNTNTISPAATLKNNANTANPAVNNVKGTVKIDGLEVVGVNAYNSSKPIPLDAKMQDGLVFRVQIGAFKNQLANDAFKGLSPLNGETTLNGYIRYTAGNFGKFENASAVKNDLHNLGYNDAFVVAYFNGKRITVAEAIALLNKEGKTLDKNAPVSAGITANSNVPKANTTITQPNLNTQDLVTITKELEQIKDLLFTVQIGVYNKEVTKQQLKNLGPLFTEKLPSGLYRYTAGIYNDTERLLTDKRRVLDIGIKDAFVSAYLNGKRISFAEGKNKKATDSTVKLEPQNPIVFPEGVINIISQPVNTPSFSMPYNMPNANSGSTTPPSITTSTVKPFTNGINTYPTATAENGIKMNEEGISYKVQIGAYSKQIPNDVAAKFSAIKNWPIENKQINSLFIYNIGNFIDAKFAKSLKDQAVSAGIKDAFITVYRDGKKLVGAESAILLEK